MIVDLVSQRRPFAQTSYTLNRRPRQAPTQDSNLTLKPQPRANRESAAKHRQASTPQEAIQQPQLQGMENSPSLAPDCRNRKPPREQLPELVHKEVAMRKRRRSRRQRQARPLPHTPDTEIFRLQEQEWILTRKKAKKNQCKISATKPILYLGPTINQPTILI